MGREVRRVPKDWQHPLQYSDEPWDWSKGRPTGGFGGERFKPLHELTVPIRELQAEWDQERADYEAEHPDEDYAAYAGNRPTSDDYMPYWPEEERTHYQMYESTSEGTPISPVCETPEELARWLTDNKASTFASFTATYEEWLTMCKAGWAPSMMVQEYTDGTKEMMSGVEALSAMKKE